MKNRYFGADAAERGWVPSPSYLLRRDRILRIVDNLPYGRVLEIGCGAGALLNDLATRGFECTALETSSTALEIARFINRDNDSVTILEKPLRSWASAYDYILAFEVLEHIQNDSAALHDWSQWLTLDGRLIISVPAHQHRWNASDVWAGHVRRYNRQDLELLLQGAGFEIEHFECYGFPLANIIEPIRARFHSQQIQKEGAESVDAAANTARSGIERSAESKLYPLLNSLPGILAMWASYVLQAAFYRYELGTGFLVLARKKRIEDTLAKA